MTDLSNLLETHTAQNSRLRDQNAQMASKMGVLVGETEKRDEMVKGLHEEAQLQIVLLQHQVQKAQIDKLTKSMTQLEKDTANWRQKYEVSSSQVKKMNTSAMERESEVVSLKKKLESMVKLNKTLSQERATLLEKCKET